MGKRLFHLAKERAYVLIADSCSVRSLSQNLCKLVAYAVRKEKLSGAHCAIFQSKMRGFNATDSRSLIFDLPRDVSGLIRFLDSQSLVTLCDAFPQFIGCSINTVPPAYDNFVDALVFPDQQNFDSFINELRAKFPMANAFENTLYTRKTA